MADLNYKIRAALLYDYKLGKTAKISHADVCKAYGDNVISYAKCTRWYKRFKEGNEDLNDKSREGRPQELNDEDLLRLIEEDPTLTGRKLAEILNHDHVTVTRHLHHLGKNNLCGRWVPHALNPANKTARVAMSSILLKMSKNSGFWDSILTSDETWISFDNPNNKRQWLSVNQNPVTVPKAPIHGQKMLLCLWWNSRGLVHFEVRKQGQTINANVYCEQLETVNQVLQNKGIDSTTIRFLHDNARPHVAKIVHQKIEEFGWNLLPHPPYSPDLAPSDYYLFRSMKQFILEKKFKNQVEVENWVVDYFGSKKSEFFDNGIRQLRKRWQAVINAGGDYVFD